MYLLISIHYIVADCFFCCYQNLDSGEAFEKTIYQQQRDLEAAEQNMFHISDHNEQLEVQIASLQSQLSLIVLEGNTNTEVSLVSTHIWAMLKVAF